MLAWLHCNKKLTPLYFILFFIFCSRRAECASVNEILVISVAHRLPSSPSTTLLCTREDLSVSLAPKEGNGTESTKFHQGLPWPSRSNRPGWRGLIMWDLVCKPENKIETWRTCHLLTGCAQDSCPVLSIHQMNGSQWAIIKIIPPVIGFGKVLNLRNFKAHLQHNVSAGFRVHLSQEPASLMHKWMMNSAVIRDSSFISTAIDTKVPESNKSNGLCNLRHGGLVSLLIHAEKSQQRGTRWL